MNNDNKLYIAYGSNLNFAQMADRCPTAHVAGVSIMEGWQLLFRDAHVGAVATVEPCEGGNVPVLVWEITPADEAALDRYEGWPFLYRKETVEVRLGGKTVRAIASVSFSRNSGSEITIRKGGFAIELSGSTSPANVNKLNSKYITMRILH